MMRMSNPFKEAWRKVRQIFESLYWFRWRNYKDRGEFLLPDSWNGSFSIYQLMLAKLEQIMHHFRKYSNEQKRYLYCDRYKNYTPDEQEFIRAYIMSQISKPGEYERYCAGFYDVEESVSHDKRCYIYITWDGEQWILERSVQTLIDPKTIKKRDKLYTLKQDGDDYKFIEAKQYKHHFETLRASREDESLEEFGHCAAVMVKEPETTVWDILMAYLQTIKVTPEWYKRMPASLRPKLCGIIPSYHQMWQFRKMLKEYIELASDFVADDDAAVKKQRHQKILELAAYIDDHGDRWWM